MASQHIYSSQMKTRLAMAFSLFFAISIPISSYAAVKAGSVCTQQGKKVTSVGKIYTCIKSGKKLVWNSGEIIKKTAVIKPTQTPTPSFKPIPEESVSPSSAPSSSPSSSPLPTQTSTTIPAIKTIFDLPTNYKFIKYWAFTKASEEIMSNAENSTPIEVLIGPNSKACYQETTLSALRMLQKVYGKSNIPKKLWLLYADMNVDRNWIENKTLTLLPPNRIQYNKNKQMDNIETSNPSGEGVLWVQNSCAAINGIKISSDVLHGYTHTIQDLQYSEYPNGYGRWGEVPRWLIEGGASWSQIFYESNSNLKKYENSGDWGVLSKYDKNFFNDYLVIPAYSNNLWQYTDQWPEMRAYDLGAYICDMLIALKGPSSIIELNKDYLVTGSFETSFRNIFGLPWAEAQPFFSSAAFSLIKWLAS